MRKSTKNGSPSFSQWLYFQQFHESEDGEMPTPREDPIGALARWVEADKRRKGEPCWPVRANTITHIVTHLRSKHAHERGAPTELQIRDALGAYKDFLAAGGTVPVRRGGQVASNGYAHRGYLLSKETIEQIRELAAATGATQGEVIERLVNRAHGRYCR